MAAIIAGPAPKATVIQWIVDTRPLWPVDSKLGSKEQVKELGDIASQALSLLPPADRSPILRYFFPRDAKMSLISALIKRYGISTLCRIPWTEATPSRKPNHKPCFTSTRGEIPPLEFNVSHQAGLVTMVSTVGTVAGVELELGTDIVCVNERDDYGKMEREDDGFFGFVDMHAEVFAESEIQYLKLSPDNLNIPEIEDMNGYGRDAVSRCQCRNGVIRWKDKKGEERTMQSNVVIDAKLRRFYTLWCLREAYVKMTGEALMASWLKELEFRRFRAPKAKLGGHDEIKAEEIGELVTDQDFEIWFKGKRVSDVRVQLTALGQDYMLATAARNVGGKADIGFTPWKWIYVEDDIYPAAKLDAIKNS